MSSLLDMPPYGPRDEAALLGELNQLAAHHLAGCEAFQRIWPGWREAAGFEELPWVHVGLFKHVDLRTEFDGARFERTLLSSATSSGVSSRIALDSDSSALQSASTLAILKDFVGDAVRPLLILDSAKSLRTRGEVSARVAAALSLRPLASEIHFLLGDAADPASMNWDLVAELAGQHDDLLVYGFTWILWLAWAASMPDEVAERLAGKRIAFVHSGGWKKLEDRKVDRAQFDGALLNGLADESRVVDYYGLVEQVGVIYPLCEAGFRHVPVWAQVIVRDPHSHDGLVGGEGQLQLLNTLARGAPYFSVLTEDLGRIVEGPCDCGRSGPRFELIGRIPKAEVRGCANV